MGISLRSFLRTNTQIPHSTMNPKMFVSMAVFGCALNSAMATLGTFSAASVGGSLGLTYTALGSTAAVTGFLTPAGAVILGGGALLLKGAALAALAADGVSLGRRRRSAEESEETDLMIAAIAAQEPEQCYRRLVCDLATGKLAKSEGDVIVTLFEKEVSAESPRYDFVTAAKIGKQVKNIEFCEYRFGCPLSGAQIQKIFKA